MTQNEIASAIIRYIDGFNLPYGHWYIGIATDPRQRLFVDHNVNENPGIWIHCRADSEQVARDTEDCLINRLGTQGDTGGGYSTIRYVYAYRVAAYTRES